MPIAAGLAAGPALEGFAALSRLVSGGVGLGAGLLKGGLALRRAAAARAAAAEAEAEAGARARPEFTQPADSAPPLSWRDPM